MPSVLNFDRRDDLYDDCRVTVCDCRVTVIHPVLLPAAREQHLGVEPSPSHLHLCHVLCPNRFSLRLKEREPSFDDRGGRYTRSDMLLYSFIHGGGPVRRLCYLVCAGFRIRVGHFLHGARASRLALVPWQSRSRVWYHYWRLRLCATCL